MEWKYCLLRLEWLQVPHHKPPEKVSTVEVPLEVIVLDLGREGQGKAIRETLVAPSSLAICSMSCMLCELQAVGCVLALHVDGKLKQFGIAIQSWRYTANWLPRPL